MLISRMPDVARDWRPWGLPEDRPKMRGRPDGPETREREPKKGRKGMSQVATDKQLL